MPHNPLGWLRSLQHPCNDCPRHAGLTASDMAVAAALIRWSAVSTCTARITVQQLADTARCDRRTVMRSTARLKQLGWLIVRSSSHGKYGKGVNLYALIIPEPVDNHAPGQEGRCHRVTYLSVTESPTHAPQSDSVTHAVGIKELEGAGHLREPVENRARAEHVAALIAELAERTAI